LVNPDVILDLIILIDGYFKVLKPLFLHSYPLYLLHEAMDQQNITGFVLLLFHNIVAHHHDDDHDDHITHHDNDVLEHAKVDHICSPQAYHFDGLHAIIPNLVYRPEYSIVQFPLVLHTQPLILPDEPYPPGWITDQPFFAALLPKLTLLFKIAQATPMVSIER
jgi:hypothetical protein